MKKRTNIIIIVSILLLTFIFFAYKAYFSPDSCWYFYMSRMFDGTVSFEKWWSVRGFTLPIYLFITTKLFGNNPFGILMGLYLLYLFMNVLGFIILKKVINIQKMQKYENKMYILYIILLIINPIIIGYSHTVLTESMAPAIILLVLLLCICWYLTDFCIKNKVNFTKNIFFVIVLSTLSVLMWFLKQPYYPVIFILILSTCLCSVIKNFNFSNIIFKSCSLLFVLFSLIMGIYSWNNFLEKENANSNEVSNFVSNSFLYALNYHYILETNSCSKSLIYDSLLNEKEKSYAIGYIDKNLCDNIKLYKVVDDNGNIIDHEVIFANTGDIDTKDSIMFVVKQGVKHPLLLLDSYYNNYMATIDLHEKIIVGDEEVANDNLIYAINENQSLAMFIFYNGPSYWWKFYTNEHGYKSYEENYEYSPYMKQFEVEKNVNEDVSNLFVDLAPIFNLLFKILFVSAPGLMIYSFVQFIRKKHNLIYMIMFLIFTSSFGHVLFHAVTGAKIDRYAYIAFPMLLIGFILLMFPKNMNNYDNNNEEVINLNIKNQTNNGKVLFVIPAYNEAENIEKVLKEIKKDVDYADILVINDCSKDNTAEIVKKNNVKCITNVFNMRYAMAVQTGIKYAYENDYDYVIQCDADGQHIAKEAEKLYKHMKKSDCDIVIGSRYLQNTGYPCPLFRRIGTKIFELLVKLFCHKKIADPLSGFQCLNRRVIEKYSKMGNYPEFPDANLVIEMLLSGYKIEETPVKMRLRETGESMHGGIIKPIKYMINMIYTIIFILIKTPRKKER